MKKTSVITQLVVLIGIILVANMLASKLFFRLDFTEDKRYSLSDATKNILSDLDNTVTIRAYFSEDLPTQLISTRQDFENLLVEYENRAGGGNIYFEFINPNENEEEEQKAQQEGVNPFILNVQGRDQMQQMRAYMGATIQMGNEKEIIPMIQPGAGMEYALTTAIKKLSVLDKPKVAFLQGHGEPDMMASAQALQQLSILYNVEPYTISATEEIPADYKTLAIIAPEDTIPNSHLMKLDNYLQNGGNIYVAYSPIKGELQTGYMQNAPNIGLKGWLQDKGIDYGDQVVVDANSASVSVQQPNYPFPIPVQFPYFPIIHNFVDHPVSKGLEQVVLQFLSALNLNVQDSAITATPLAYTSEYTGFINVPTAVDINKEWSESDFTANKQAVALALEGPIVGSKNSKLVVVANGEFAVNREGGGQLQPDNVNLVVNAIDWLSDDTGLIELRTKGVTSRPLEQMEEGSKTFISYFNVFAPILLILLYAVYRRQKHLKKQQRWLEGKYD